MRHLAACALLAGALGLVPAAAANADPAGNNVIGYGTVTEYLGGPASNWTINFSIHTRGNGNSTLVSVTQGGGGPTSTFTGTTCSGTYTDPVLGGTDVYAVGPVISGNQIFGTPYEAYVIHEGGDFGADMSQVLPVALPDLESAQAFCGSIATNSPAFALVDPSSATFPH